MFELVMAVIIFFIPGIAAFMFVFLKNIFPGLIEASKLCILFTFQFYAAIWESVLNVVKTMVFVLKRGK